MVDDARKREVKDLTAAATQMLEEGKLSAEDYRDLRALDASSIEEFDAMAEFIRARLSPETVLGMLAGLLVSAMGPEAARQHILTTVSLRETVRQRTKR